MSVSRRVEWAVLVVGLWLALPAITLAVAWPSEAGGGGFLLVYCPPERHERLAKGMAEHRLLPFALERDGSKTIFNYRRDVGS